MGVLKFEGHWSFSWLMKYERCPMMFKLAKIDKLPEPARDPDNPMERGNRIHKNLEDFVKGQAELKNEARQLAKFEPYLNHLRELWACGQATAEEDWLFNRDWDVTGKHYTCEAHGTAYNPECDECVRRHWLWAKLDASVFDPTQSLAIAIDYKSGKSQYKAVEHIQQLQLYAAISALKFPEADWIHTELWYVDETNERGEAHVRAEKYTREQSLSFIGRFQTRVDRIYADRMFRPNPNKMTCTYCPYGPRNGTGACPVGV